MKIADSANLEQYLIDVYRLKNVVRYNTRNVIKKESVAEHSFYVALFTLKICNDYNVDSRTEKRAIIKALLHDMPEIELNDITHDVKEKLNLRPFLKKYEDEYFDTHFSEYRSLMKEGDEKTNAIVDYADTMSVYQYILNEELLGNKSNDIQKILNSTKIRIKKCKERLEKILFKAD
jgi:5'-deoxynucleotidase YfbR-like HD superfamily hydrolase